MDQLLTEISKLSKIHKITKVILFGSRARDDAKERSDYDLAIYTNDDDSYSSFISDLSELPTLHKIDTVRITNRTSSELLKNIAKDGIVL